MASILFLAFTSDFSTSLILLLYSFPDLDLYLWCWTPSPSSILEVLVCSAWSRSCITWLSFSGIPSAETFLPLLNDAFVHLSNPNSILMSSNTFFTVLISPVSWLSLIQYSFRSSTQNRWLILVCSSQLVSISCLLEFLAERLRDMVKSNGLSESPWNIPLVILIGPVSRTPCELVSCWSSTGSYFLL